MFNGMMDPEMMRMAQEQMSRMSPADMARIQQQVILNSLLPEDFKQAAEQLKHTSPEELAEIREKMATASPEELASMRARMDSHMSYEVNAAEMLKKQGNELHSQGKYKDALEKYMRAKKNLKEVPSSKARNILLACSLNMMSCYLKTKQYDECIREGTEVMILHIFFCSISGTLSTHPCFGYFEDKNFLLITIINCPKNNFGNVLACDANNVKALYRRGQAYKESGQLGDAVSDLCKAHDVSPEDETIEDVLRDAEEKLIKEGGVRPKRGLVIEEITEEETASSDNQKSENSPLKETSQCSTSQAENSSEARPTNTEYFEALKDNPESVRSFQDFISRTDPETLSALNGGKVEGISPDMVKTASSVIGKMSPEELQRMFKLASSFEGGNPFSNSGSSFSPGSIPSDLSPDMLKTATDMMGKMPPDQLQKMFEMASSLKGNEASSSSSSSKAAGFNTSTGPVPPNVTPDMLKMATDMMGKMSTEERQKMFEIATSLRGQETTPSISNGLRSNGFPKTRENFEVSGNDVGESSSSQGLNSSSNPSSLLNSSTDLQEQMRNQMKDPAMRQMFSSMMKNISPEMMANMSEQFGLKLSPEDAEKAQQAMSSLSPEALDKMMKWADRIQRGVEGARKTKNWVLGKPGMILAIFVLFLAFVLHWFGFIGR
ncbi:hypothetical protein RD792_003105 [Penstemon davidsonii]|uniref:Outer envelope protein 61 n=1 Tax=Penstemon davidsonii TaxID=160366 RepID=A0ABR0DSX2_9LAMI|nr:hypothetical protein RD792_003105 [Penstemon davidsonii]